MYVQVGSKVSCVDGYYYYSLCSVLQTLNMPVSMSSSTFFFMSGKNGEIDNIALRINTAYKILIIIIAITSWYFAEYVLREIGRH